MISLKTVGCNTKHCGDLIARNGINVLRMIKCANNEIFEVCETEKKKLTNYSEILSSRMKLNVLNF